MKLFLDDKRPCPEGFVLALTAKQAFDHLRTGKVEEISFDHDLGEPEEEVGNGHDVAQWIEVAAYNGDIPKLLWSIHSSNPIGRARIQAAMKNAERFWADRERKQI